MIVGRTMWTQSTSVTDRQTDGQTDRRTDRITITKTVQRRASHGKNCHKSLGGFIFDSHCRNTHNTLTVKNDARRPVKNLHVLDISSPWPWP